MQQGPMTIPTTAPRGRLPRLLLLAAAALAPLGVPQAGQAQDRLERQYMEACQAGSLRNAPMAAPDYVREICVCRYQELKKRLTGPQIQALAGAYTTTAEWGTIDQSAMDIDMEVVRTCITRAQGVR